MHSQSAVELKSYKTICLTFDLETHLRAFIVMNLPLKLASREQPKYSSI